MKMHLVGILAILLIIDTEILGHPSQERLMPDGAPVPEDAVSHEDSVASASEVGEEYDDSDMYMEPDESGTLQTDRVENSTRNDNQDNNQDKDKSKETSPETEKVDASKDQEAKNTQHTAVAQFTDTRDRSLETQSQNFFPSFAELFANHRLPFAEQQQRYRPNRFLGYFQRDRNYQTAASKDQHSLLGSGNFGVIRGGTYYPEEKENDEYSIDESVYNPYYNRGRAQYYRNPKPQPVRGGDFFANFRDFADITAPPKSSFSHLSIVYANKNGSSTGRVTEPRNIIETLRMLEEEERSNVEEITTTETPQKKQSKGKWKLMKMKQYEEDKARRSRMAVEPLLALS
ncbi:LOW QUALITY PROTEIN: uncharacterized protein LOC114928869 [Nylanderia fulva]|uniref:LOW QUALITY PROTEIN: uncharacterized protein LOC114928869 n=1 Tax=Nylanderia fulva TaxID=613905 RepID=UPI0010FBBD77|nr:LOW QUALITY PROTEIN: uncharacterized protein LOC114928869 [Nylanderia fulva]